ncbi:putative RNA-binding Zn ribbon-like protein [Microbacterium sp. SORGH_AS 1204]|uniref:CGNR zinc finger domain-containing protein n=1 Tax=Microbacterium sp. SORGH_AS_1204 TaxID=3041785 RepID=UPI00278F7CF6|nr:CGNR zinc finger domain-containing protein [Microbacterium sp. SORGH_AS_1204]MDQ1137751.1 putative RNA-binding Zn ribbon-like protein [Microbacterium sp. SORGH_AS_1204]
MPDRAPEFRVGSVLATSFTGTLTERRGTPVERIPTPERLADWLTERDLAVDRCSPADLTAAVELREAIHAAATAGALDQPHPQDAVEVINRFAAHGGAVPALLDDGRRHWRLGEPATVAAALSVVAADAIEMLAGVRPGTLALCASPTCRAAFFDTSRGRTRRWCDMNTCGNHEKKARLKARRG